MPNVTLGTGFSFTEGPVWRPVEHYLLFSDVPADVRRCWDARGGVQEVMRPSNKCSGMTYDADPNLIVCEHATSTVGPPDWRREMVASHFDGIELNSPNELCIHSDGSINFSDPWYGRARLGRELLGLRERVLRTSSTNPTLTTPPPAQSSA